MAKDRDPLPGEVYQKPKKKSLKETAALVRRFFPYFKKHIPTLFMVLCCTGLCAGCEVYLPIIVRNITNTATSSPDSLTIEFIIRTCAVYAVLKGLDAIANYCQSYYGHWMGVQIEGKMREDLFDHLQSLDFTYFDNTKVGQLMSRMTGDLFDVAEWAHHFPEMVFTTIVKFIAGFYIFAQMDIRFALIIFAMLPFMIICTKKSRSSMKETFRESRYQVGEINAKIEDNLLGTRVVRSFTNEKTEKEKFLEGSRKYFEIKKKNYRYMSSFHATVRLIDGIMYITVVGVGAWFMHVGITTAGDFAASLLLVSTLLSSIRSIIDFSEQFSRGITGVERFTEVMDIKPEIADKEGAEELTDVVGNIDLKDVSFNYYEGSRTILDHINIHIEKGKSLAIVGPSGGGKTTLCNLIPRFYEATDGEILIDGKNIKDVTLNSLRRNIGVVQQDVYLFYGTIKENIAYGRPGATDEEIVEAAKLAGAHEFIMGLENGYDTYTGERGVKLSGGQKQRISIARVFLKNPPILLLDEATSALDNESERLVQKSLEELAKGRTTLTIAHRLTTIRNADEIIVLTRDGIAETGSHEELMAKGGIYADMYKLYA